MEHALSQFAGEVSEYDWPTISCPTCKIGSVPYSKVDMFEDPTSASWRDHDSWDPDMIFGSFMGALKCTNPHCCQAVLVTGTYTVVHNNGEPEYGDYGELYRLKSFDPPLALADVPSSAPPSVKDAVAASARIVWLDPSSAANRLRTAVERVLDDKRVKKTRINNGGTRVRMTTHARIEQFRLKDQLAGDAMMAVKWIGNEGTHESELTIQDVLDGATVLQLALKVVYDKADLETRRRITAINKARGLPRTRSRP